MIAYHYYIEAIKKAALGLVLISAAAAVLAFVWAERIQPDYEVHFSYLVTLSERETSSGFRYDGYYALSATDLFTTTLASWVKTPEVIAAAYRQVGLAMPSEDTRVLLRAVQANKTGPQLVEVVVRHKDREKAIRLSEGVQAVMKSNVEKYHEEGIPALVFNAVPTESWVGVGQVAARVISASVFLLVLFGGVNVVLLAASLSPEAKELES